MKIKAKVTSLTSNVTNGKLYNVVDKYSEGYLIMSDDGVAVKINHNNCEMKYKVGDYVAVCEDGDEYEGIIVKIDMEDPNYTYQVFVYDTEDAGWYRETELK